MNPREKKAPLKPPIFSRVPKMLSTIIPNYTFLLSRRILTVAKAFVFGSNVSSDILIFSTLTNFSIIYAQNTIISPYTKDEAC